MAWRFNPPPGWPQPPSDDWMPPRGWQPDPAWPIPRDGWMFVVRVKREGGWRPGPAALVLARPG